MAKLKTAELVYEPGEFYITQGHKYGEKSHYNRRDYVNPIGFGNATELKGSRLWLYVYATDGKIGRLRIDPYLKENVGRLTKKLIKKLENAIPDYVHLVNEVSDYGNEYVTVKEKDMIKWIEEAGIKK